MDAFNEYLYLEDILQGKNSLKTFSVFSIHDYFWKIAEFVQILIWICFSSYVLIEMSKYHSNLWNH